MTRGSRRQFQLAAAILFWAACSAVFACCRTPYDDELWSLAATRVPSAHLLAVLAADVHPPWLALIDRLLGRFFQDPHWFMVARLVPSAIAVWLLSRVAQRRLGVRWPVLAAFHPVVFMYAAAARWYPAAFLMQAARAWALWGTRRRRSAWAAFGAGALVGPMTGYADLLFLGHDCLWFVQREGRRGRGCRAAGFVAALGLLDVLVLACSPLSLWHQSRRVGMSERAIFDSAELLATGLAGQALLPALGGVLALIAFAGFGWAAWKAFDGRRTRSLFWWLAATTSGWLVLACIGYHQPRYCLLVWFLWTASLLALANREGSSRAVAVGTAGYLALALVLTLSQRDFVKADLNEPPDELCSALSNSGAGVVFAPYPRTARQLARHCALRARIVSSDWRAYVDPLAAAGSGFADVDEAVLGQPEALLLTTPSPPDSAMAAINDAARRWLTANCQPGPEKRLVPSPYYELKHLFNPETSRWRFSIQRWNCRPSISAEESR